MRVDAAQDLRSAGISLWFDQLDLHGGDRWDRAVEEALRWHLRHDGGAWSHKLFNNSDGSCPIGNRCKKEIPLNVTVGRLYG